MNPNARSVSLYVLNRCFKSGAWSSQLLNSELNILDEREAALATNITLGVLQNYRLLDFYIDSLTSKLDLPVRNILRIGIYQILFLDKVPIHAAVNESVELAKANGYKSASGLVNAVLRKIDPDILSQVSDLSVKYSHPKWFVDRMISEYGKSFTEQLLIANNSTPDTLYHRAFNGNETYVQDKAAYDSVVMAEPKDGMKVLDSCAAPGGKSFTSAVLMNNKGSILSCDIHDKKLSLIKNNAERLGISIISTKCENASVFNSDYENAFDFVIADVPCSGFGVIRKKPEIRFKSEEEIKGLPDIQKKIINNVSRYVVPGGKLLYSTCTVFKEENEEVARSIDGFEIIKEKTFWPNIDFTDGFYACVLRKKI